MRRRISRPRNRRRPGDDGEILTRAGWPRLVYDVGVHNGDDSAYYLHKGYRVVGVEANPLAIPLLRRRFESQIADGRYVLVPKGVAETAGEAPFWVCDDQPKWSSFDRDVASRNGARHHCVTVGTCRFGSIVEEFGPASYCKIDIEGNDDLCLADLTPATAPRFLSVEMLDGELQLRRLDELGYARFKIISQRTFRPASHAMLSLKARLPALARRLVSAAEVAAVRHGSDGSWRFPRGSSGPFGEDTPGPWRSLDDALATWRRILRLGHDLSEWHDIHAALDQPPDQASTRTRSPVAASDSSR